MSTKTTIGFVTQFYNDEGKCTSQEFIAGDQVDWEDESGEPCDVPKHEDQLFDMVQPEKDIPHIGTPYQPKENLQKKS